VLPKALSTTLGKVPEDEPGVGVEGEQQVLARVRPDEPFHVWKGEQKGVARQQTDEPVTGVVEWRSEANATPASTSQTKMLPLMSEEAHFSSILDCSSASVFVGWGTRSEGDFQQT
jgi:hypothetical protein